MADEIQKLGTVELASRDPGIARVAQNLMGELARATGYMIAVATDQLKLLSEVAAGEAFSDSQTRSYTSCSRTILQLLQTAHEQQNHELVQRELSRMDEQELKKLVKTTARRVRRRKGLEE